MLLWHSLIMCFLVQLLQSGIFIKIKNVSDFIFDNSNIFFIVAKLLYFFSKTFFWYGFWGVLLKNVIKDYNNLIGDFDFHWNLFRGMFCLGSSKDFRILNSFSARCLYLLAVLVIRILRRIVLRYILSLLNTFQLFSNNRLPFEIIFVVFSLFNLH